MDSNSKTITAEIPVMATATITIHIDNPSDIPEVQEALQARCKELLAQLSAPVVVGGSGEVAPASSTPSAEPAEEQTAEQATKEDPLPANRYRQEDGTTLFVDDGIGNGREWGTFYEKANGSLKRVVSKAMPMVPDRNEAQRNLDKWAQSHGLPLAADDEPIHAEPAQPEDAESVEQPVAPANEATAAPEEPVAEQIAEQAEEGAVEVEPEAAQIEEAAVATAEQETEEQEEQEQSSPAEWSRPTIYVGDKFWLKRSEQKPGVAYDIFTVAEVNNDFITRDDGQKTTYAGFLDFYEVLTDAELLVMQQQHSPEPAVEQSAVDQPAESTEKPVIDESSSAPDTASAPAAEGNLIDRVKPGDTVLQVAQKKTFIVGPETTTEQVQLCNENGEPVMVVNAFLFNRFYEIVSSPQTGGA
jgi:hypothetical protein